MDWHVETNPPWVIPSKRAQHVCIMILEFKAWRTFAASCKVCLLHVPLLPIFQGRCSLQCSPFSRLCLKPHPTSLLLPNWQINYYCNVIMAAMTPSTRVNAFFFLTSHHQPSQFFNLVYVGYVNLKFIYDYIFYI